jgi:hypothetical protein
MALLPGLRSGSALEHRSWAESRPSAIAMPMARMRKKRTLPVGEAIYQIDLQQPLEQRLRISKLENSQLSWRWISSDSAVLLAETRTARLRASLAARAPDRSQ